MPRVANDGSAMERACHTGSTGMPGTIMRLTVLSVSYPLAQVSDGTAGGAEQILGCLDAGLVHAGHRSVVLAPEGSRCRGLLIPTPVSACPLTDEARRRAQTHYREAVQNALLRF